MDNNPFKQLSIRTGLAWQEDAGYILACDPTTEENNPHVKIYLWFKGSFSDSWAKFNAHSICRISNPENALVFVSSEGFYGVNSKTSIAGNIFEDSQPEPIEPRYGSIRAVSEIKGKAYAVGLRGMVYRFDKLAMWTRIDDDLPREFNIQAIHGFDEYDIYAVGFSGQLWHFNGKKWRKLQLPTNLNLTAVKCSGDGLVYIAGHKGILMCGRDDNWQIIDHGVTMKDIWSLEWFEEKLYLSTMSNVFRLDRDKLEMVDFDDDVPTTCYHLSAAKNVMWSIGEKDVMSFDGKKWSRIV